MAKRKHKANAWFSNR